MKTTRKQNLLASALIGTLAWSNTNAQTAAYVPDRTVLPLAEPTYPPITEIDARKATPPPRFEPTAPKGAPNVVVILLDNVGYGATKPFGGVINMPTLQRLAQSGLITIIFTRHRSARPAAWRCSPAAIRTAPTWAPSRKSPRRFRARPRNGP